MARIPTVAALTRRMNYLKQRDANLKARQQAEPKVGSGQANPMETVKYNSIFTKQAFTLNAPSAGINFFGDLGALGLAAPDDSPRLPRGFKYAKIRATRGRENGTRKVADLSKRPYLKYTVDGDGGTRVSFTAPVSAATAEALSAKVRTLMLAKTNDVGEYGRIWFEPERPIINMSGDTGGTTTTP